MAVERSIEVIHYGPKTVPDPDHSTSVIVRSIDSENAHNNRTWVLSLESDEELDELINQLVDARQDADDVTAFIHD